MGKSTTSGKTLFSGQASPDGRVSYSGDQPNPELRTFVERHMAERPYDPAGDDYAVRAFDKPIEATKATPLYNMHAYWSKKPHDAIRQYIRHYTKPGDLVLDPFCGSGGTALAAVMDGRKAVAIDRSPAAAFITKSYCTPVNPDELRAAFEGIKAKIKDEIAWLYDTKCDRCGGHATTAYTVYSQVFQCPRCLDRVPLFDCVEVAGETAAGKPQMISVCPHCLTRGVREEITARMSPLGSVPVLTSYVCDSGCKPGRDERRYNDPDIKKREFFERYDLGKIREIDALPLPHWVPPQRMMNVDDDNSPWGDEWRQGRNFRTVVDLFTKRNLWALGAIRECLTPAGHALSAFNAALLNSSKLYRHRTGGGGGPAGNYYMPQLSREMSAWLQFQEKVNEYCRIDVQFTPDAVVSTQSAMKLDAIPAASVDYVFTDPPYSEKVQYGELNFIWEAWLGFDTRWHHEEIIVNQTRGKSEADWTRQMRVAMQECHRVLKPGRWVSLCYHDTSEGTWASLQDLMAEVGFVAEHSDVATYIDTGQKSFNQLMADKVNKRDLVINFRKPRPGEVGGSRVVIPEGADAKTFADLARQVIRDYLQANPASTKDRVYDELVSRMVRAGQMQAHNFDDLLREVADEVKDAGGASRWYLKESEEGQVDAAEAAKEDDAAKAMEKFIAKTLEKSYAEGVHYSDLFEHYLYAVKDKPRRSLADWLPDYFFKTEDGTWRLPVDEDERELKEQARASGENRRIKRYAAMLQAGVAVPKERVPSAATLAEWIRHAKRSGLYEAGKLLYERGGLDTSKLSEEQQVEVEEDYQVCVRALQRAAGGEAATTGKKKGRKKKSD